MFEVYKSKSQYREESKDAIAEFLARGGSIEVVKAKKAPKQKMRAKSSKGFRSASMNLGYTKSSIGVDFNSKLR